MRSRFRHLVGLFALVPAFSLVACAGRTAMVKIPSSDATPPSAALEVLGAGEPIRLGVGEEPVKVDLSPSDSVVITAVGEDGDGGVRNISLQGNVQVTCRDASTGASRSRTTGFLRRHEPGSLSPRRGPVRQDSRFVLRASDLVGVCRGGRLESAVGQATAQVANFNGGGASSPRLEFRLAGGEVAATAIPMPVRVPLVRTRSLAATGTGFVPTAGKGGSGGGTAELPLQCPINQAPGRALESEAAVSPLPCLDPPVPFMSPPALAPLSPLSPFESRGRSRTSPG